MVPAHRSSGAEVEAAEGGLARRHLSWPAHLQVSSLEKHKCAHSLVFRARMGELTELTAFP